MSITLLQVTVIIMSKTLISDVVGLAAYDRNILYFKLLPQNDQFNFENHSMSNLGGQT